MLIELWFFLLGIFLIIYVVLDGFDLGGAFISPIITKEESERRIILNAIGKVWDANEVWLISFGAFLFGMFPLAYAKFFSAAYIPVMLLVFALIFRAVSFEFRSQVNSKTWKSIWDWILSISSLLIIIILSAAGANILKGVDLSDENFRLNLIDALNPFALITALTTTSFIVYHSLLYLSNKTEGELLNKVKKFSNIFFYLSIVTLILWTIFSLFFEKQIFTNIIKYPLIVIVPTLSILSFIFSKLSYEKNKKLSFLLSSLNIGGVILTVGLLMYPALIRSSKDPIYDITIYKAASNELTLTIGFIVALVGIILVSIYQYFIYKTFSGTIKSEDIHY
ncbi:MAG: cytochrome d ubiquinol oxidase subunit II [Brevinematia bacterium]